MDTKKWIILKKGKLCSLCNLSHCLEVGIDYTEGCCICYNIQMEERGETPITLCDGCEEI